MRLECLDLLEFSRIRTRDIAGGSTAWGTSTVTPRKSLKGGAEPPEIDIDSVPGRMILVRMVATVRTEPNVPGGISDEARKSIARLRRQLRKAMKLYDAGESGRARAVLLKQRKDIEASFYAKRKHRPKN